MVEDRGTVRSGCRSEGVSAFEEEAEFVLVELVGGASELDLGKEDGEGEVVGVEEGAGGALEGVEEEVVDEDTEPGLRLSDALEGRVVEENEVEDVEEEAERELVEVVKEVKLLEDEEDAAARLSERQVLVRDRLDLRHDVVRLLDLARNVGGLTLQRLERLDDPEGRRRDQWKLRGNKRELDVLVVIEDVALRLVESREKTLLEVVKAGTEFALETKKVGTLLVDFGTLDSEDLGE